MAMEVMERETLQYRKEDGVDVFGVTMYVNYDFGTTHSKEDATLTRFLVVRGGSK